MNLKKYKDFKNFIELSVLDKILNSVKEYLPEDLKYIKIYNELVGYDQCALDLKFYGSNWKELNLNHEFNEEEIKKYDDMCLYDFISNSLVGMNGSGIITFDDCDEFFDKIGNNTEYVYEYKKEK